MDRRDTADRIEPALANEPTEQMQANEATEPIDRTDPAEPMLRIEPEEPIDRIDPLDPMLRIEPAEPPWPCGDLRVVAMGPVWQVSAARRDDRRDDRPVDAGRARNGRLSMFRVAPG